MAVKMEVHAYLAGPDVFFPDAKAIGERKKAALAALGIIGHFPFDNDVSPDDPDAASKIAKANERMMLDCCKDGRIGVILTNMEPFHGPSMDVGTAFEAGFMSALAEVRANVIIIGYTTNPAAFEERVINQIYGGRKNIRAQEGRLFGPDGNAIEAFGNADNLMIVHAIDKTGGAIVSSFEDAAKLAQKLSELMQEPDAR